MTIFQQMTDCDGKSINFFTNQPYNIINGGSKDGYLIVAPIYPYIGSNSGESSTSWRFISTDQDNYYAINHKISSGDDLYLGYDTRAVIPIIPVDFPIIYDNALSDKNYWCLKQSSYGFNIINKNSGHNYLNFANVGHQAIITSRQSGDIWTLKPVDYTVNAKVQSITHTQESKADYSSHTDSFTKFPSGITASSMQINNCQLASGESSDTLTIGGSVSHSITISHSESFSKGVKVGVEAGSSLFTDIIANAKIKIEGQFVWSHETSNSDTGTVTQEYSQQNTLTVPAGKFEVAQVTYNFISNYDSPFYTISLVSAVSDGKTVDNKDLIIELLKDSGSKVIIKEDIECDATQVGVETRGVLSTNGGAGEFTVVNTNKPCPAENTESHAEVKPNIGEEAAEIKSNIEEELHTEL